MDDTGILILHGFAGDTEDVRLLADYMEQRGYAVECPLLAGHGKSKGELRMSTYRDWIASAEQAYLRLSKRCRRIIAVGFSMGGLLAVNLWNYGFSGIVTVNTPVYYWNFKQITANLTKDFGGYAKKYCRASGGSSLISFIEFQKLLTRTKPMFGNLTSRALIIQAMDDDTVHYKSADYIYHRVCAEKTICRLPHGGHMVFHSASGRKVCEEVENFVKITG